ncbi:flagellar biosynthesis, FliO family protein [Escherichia coli MP020940.1]|nr:flagellar biosynthesis, FliO family protein [Escherichia coli MP020940.1]ENF19241.1 flagellar biosynthesis, FliO family protein [Escherichia coli P0304816.11]ENF34484.1 flagellar biosynthesis, FliO family protein [Escherichia coli P0304816.14]ENF52474.1 flagellar biosynthesis, FliO family protein [Escherichia coli P0304816.6]ENF62172.1 flagellar biosynthesis, FliO family protein [Escherichia coli P0304816.7]ENF69039.1 flagellar biosynthesis, FliO family protein [Escherichia coli P0304816.8]
MILIKIIRGFISARLVLGVTAGQINLLHKLPPSAPTEEIPQPDFQSVMKNLLKRSGRS